MPPLSASRTFLLARSRVGHSPRPVVSVYSPDTASIVLDWCIWGLRLRLSSALQGEFKDVIHTGVHSTNVDVHSIPDLQRNEFLPFL